MNLPTKPQSDICVFTIVSRNYLHYARTLMQSVGEYAAECDRYICLCDQPDDADFSREPFRVIGLDELQLPNPQAFIFQYTVIELNTAVKPYVFQALFERYGYEKVIYLDPDIRLYHGLKEMVGLLDSHPIILTPHLTEPLDDDRHPSDHSILQTGAYNLGYLGLCRNTATGRLLNWWQGKTSRDCVVDVANGFFVDQKWMDLVPGFFDGTLINRDPGWNVAYWNLKHRKITYDGTRYHVNGKPLVFFHFSGITLDGKSFSRYQDRFTMATLDDEVRGLVESYVETLRTNGGGKAASLKYAYSHFPDGTPIPDVARLLFREHRNLFESLDPYVAEGARQFVEFSNRTAVQGSKTSAWITQLAYRAYLRRQDLKDAFPDIFGADGIRYAQWFVENAWEQERIGDAFLSPMRRALASGAGLASLASNIAAAQVMTSSRGGVHTPFYQRAYKILYAASVPLRLILRGLLPYEVRNKLHRRVMRLDRHRDISNKDT